MQEPKILTIEDMHYVGLELDHNVHTTAKEGNAAIPALWDSLEKRSPEISRRVKVLLGVSGPIRKGGLSLYSAAVQVSGLEKIPAGMKAGTIPGGKYAEFTHRGPISNFAETVSFIHNQWMPTAGFKDHDCSQVEVFSPDADVHATDFEMKVLVPLH